MESEGEERRGEERNPEGERENLRDREIVRERAER